MEMEWKRLRPHPAGRVGAETMIVPVVTSKLQSALVRYWSWRGSNSLPL